MVARSWLVEDPICSDLTIVRRKTGTNFPLSETHARRLRHLWERTGVDWTRAECVAALRTYELTLGAELSKKAGSPIADLALLTGRAVGGAYNKVLNFRSLDARDDRAGLSSVGAQDRQVWKEFYDVESQAIRSAALDAEFLALWKDEENPIATEPSRVLEGEYLDADESVSLSMPAAASTNPDAVGRGWQAHAKTQNALAKHLRSHGIVPRPPSLVTPQFDLVWKHEGSLYVAEVKSTGAGNEEKQLRLGLGQVLRYQYLLGQDVRAVLVAEQQPVDESWIPTCKQAGVILVWPNQFSGLPV
jgi:hypothetical protein